jgi:peptidyl-prolyl cis-trans isomerase SurA
MDVGMTRAKLTLFAGRRLLAAGFFLVAMLSAPLAAHAQVVVLVNGMPITDYDIQQRSKLISVSTHKTPTRQAVLDDLINDKLKISKAKFYGFEVSDSEIDNAFDNMAKRQHLSTQQFAQMLEHAGLTADTIKARLRAELTWQQLIRGKFGPSLEVGESDIESALRARSEDTKDSVGYIYTLYPVIVIVPRGSSAPILDAKRHEADNLRSRFLNCNEGLALARALRDVAVREPISRSSSDLTPQLREVLASIEVGKLTTPDVTAQGLQMFAVCSRKRTTQESPLKTELREQIYNKRFEAASRKYLDEIRRQAMIEYEK